MAALSGADLAVALTPPPGYDWNDGVKSLGDLLQARLAQIESPEPVTHTIFLKDKHEDVSSQLANMVFEVSNKGDELMNYLRSEGDIVVCDLLSGEDG